MCLSQFTFDLHQIVQYPVSYLQYVLVCWASLQDTLLRYICVTVVYLLSRLVAFTAANTRVFKVSPDIGMARFWMYVESLNIEHHRLGSHTCLLKND